MFEIKHYNNIESKAKEAVEWFLKASKRIDIEQEEPVEELITFSFLRSNGYLKQEDLIDINNINYCDGYVVYRIENHNVSCLNIYIKCKKYKTENYDNNNVESFSCSN